MVIEIDREYGLKNCICRGCPSFTECSENIAYCVATRSKCITEKNGCICGGCPVFGKLGLKDHYFCVK